MPNLHVSSKEPYYPALPPPAEAFWAGYQYSYMWSPETVETVKAQYSAWLGELSDLVRSGQKITVAKKHLATKYPKFVLKKDVRDEIIGPEIKIKRAEAQAKYEAAARAEMERRNAPLSDEYLALDDQALLSLALRCMHALNRRAKAQFNTVIDKHTIYGLKIRFLTALVEAGKATVGKFSVERAGVDWDGEYTEYSANYYLIKCQEYGFHQPGRGCGRATPAASALAIFDSVAVAIEPHEPTNPNREIPDLGIDSHTQMKIVALCCQRLTPSEVLS